jgi:hypothetical protein
MANVVNKSQFTVHVNPAGAIAVCLRPGTQSGAFTDDQLREWSKGRGKSYIGAGLVLIQYDANKAKAPEPEAPAKAPADGKTAFQVLHYKLAVGEVKACEDLDLLETYLAVEERATVRKAIQDRMAEIHA